MAIVLVRIVRRTVPIAGSVIDFILLKSYWVRVAAVCLEAADFRKRGVGVERDFEALYSFLVGTSGVESMK